MSAILSYAWPGNIRELENTVERACVIGSPPYVQEDDLLLNIRTMPDNTTIADKSLKNVLNLFKKHYLQKVLEENDWNQTLAAQVLVLPVGNSTEMPTLESSNANGYKITGNYLSKYLGSSHAGVDLANGDAGGEVGDFGVGGEAAKRVAGSDA